jgi:hypothetical protein
MISDIELLLDSVRKRWNDLAGAPEYRESLCLHLQSLGRDLTAEACDSGGVTFPSRLSIAFAICKCGVKEFIVDGSTQECQNCGSLMFRTDVADYQLLQSPAKAEEEPAC